MKPAQNAAIEEKIKAAQENVSRKKASVKKAENNLDIARNELYALECERDFHYIQSYIQSFGDKLDLDLMFNYKPGQTEVITKYRENAFASMEIEMHGSYNSDTMQHNFVISFETNDRAEIVYHKPKVEFIFQNLKATPKGNKKAIFVRNIPNWDCIWQLEYSNETNLFSFVKTAYQCEKERYSFTSLEAALEKIQSMSDTNLEWFRPNPELTQQI